MAALKPLIASHPELFINRDGSKLNASIASGVSTIDAYSISKFAIDQIILIGELGSEGSEIIKTHASTAPSGNTITLASTTVKAHQKDAPVTILPYDKIEFSYATADGESKTVLTTDDIDAERMHNLYENDDYTSGVFYVRYKNSIETTFSDYSDAIAYTGLAKNTIGYAIETSMQELHVDFSSLLTLEMMFRWSNQMLRLVRGKMKSWNKYQETEVIGTVEMGVRSYAMPTTIYDKNSDRSILNVRIGSSEPLTYIDKGEYTQGLIDRAYTEVATEASASDTSLILDDTSDLPATGSLAVYVSGTKYSITYTANDKDTNTLTVASDQITVTYPVDSQVWYNVSESYPDYYSVWDGRIYLWPMINTTHAGKNVTMDFYTDVETLDSQTDVVLGTKYDMLIPYLKFKIRAVTENNGKEDLSDPSYLQFRELLGDAIDNDRSAQVESFQPRSSSIYGGRSGNSRR